MYNKREHIIKRLEETRKELGEVNSNLRFGNAELN